MPEPNERLKKILITVIIASVFACVIGLILRCICYLDKEITENPKISFSVQSDETLGINMLHVNTSGNQTVYDYMIDLNSHVVYMRRNGSDRYAIVPLYDEDLKPLTYEKLPIKEQIEDYLRKENDNGT